MKVLDSGPDGRGQVLQEMCRSLSDEASGVRREAVVAVQRACQEPLDLAAVASRRCPVCRPCTATFCSSTALSICREPSL